MWFPKPTFCVLVLALLASSSAWAGSIAIPGAVEVRSAKVHLGDVARLGGFDRETRTRLAAIDLGPAPLVGTGRLLPRAYLKSALSGVDVPPGTQLRLPERLELTRASEILKGATLSRAVEDALRQALPPGVEVSSVRVPLLSDLRIPAGSTYEITLARTGDLAGPVTAEVTFKDDGALVRTQRISLHVDAVGRAYVAAGPLGRGQTLGENEIREVRLPESQIPEDAVRSLADLGGAILRRPLEDGEPLTRRALELPPLVSRGDRVTMIAQSGGIRITAVGEALGSGRRGETVKVRNVDSQKIVSGRVSASQTVSMEL